MTQPVPSVPAFPAGYAPVAADFTTWVTDPFTYLATPTVFRGQLQASKAVSTYTLMQLDTILEDPYGGWSATATGSQAAYSWLTPAGCSGWYEITLTAFTANPGSTTDQLQALVYLNGSYYAQTSDSWGVNGGASGSSGVVPLPLLGGVDYVQMYIYSTASVNTPATAGQYPAMEIAWLTT